MERSRYLLSLALLGLVLLIGSISAEEGAERYMGARRAEGPDHGGSRHRTAFFESGAACRAAVVGCHNASQPFTCLAQIEVKDAKCQSLVRGVLACRQDAAALPGCESTTHFVELRQCLRRLRETGGHVSGECLTSGFVRLRHRRSHK